MCHLFLHAPAKCLCANDAWHSALKAGCKQLRDHIAHTQYAGSIWSAYAVTNFSYLKIKNNK